MKAIFPVWRSNGSNPRSTSRFGNIVAFLSAEDWQLGVKLMPCDTCDTYDVNVTSSGLCFDKPAHVKLANI